MDDEENPGPFRPLTFPLCSEGDRGKCRERKFDDDCIGTCLEREVDLERPRFVFGEHTEQESSVQLTELFDGDLVTYLLDYSKQKPKQ